MITFPVVGRLLLLLALASLITATDTRTPAGIFKENLVPSGSVGLEVISASGDESMTSIQ